MNNNQPYIVRYIAVKIASRCNINCKYCYIYNMGDHSFEHQPKIMSREVYRELANRIREHCFEHDLDWFRIFLFGGEPLLAGKEFIKEFVTYFRYVCEPDIKLDFGVQTNGTLLDAEWYTLLKKLGVRVGISLDGPKEFNDMNRVDMKGEGTYDRVMEAVETIRPLGYKPAFNCFLNIDADPVETYNHFKKTNIAALDFLFPDANFFQLPKGLHHSEDHIDWSNTPYADWWIRLFDHWFYDSQPKPKIRYLDNLIKIILGHNVGYDNAGIQRFEFVMLETNGDMEAVDDLRVCGDGFTQSKFNIMTSPLQDAVQNPLIRMHMSCKEKLCRQCQVCPAKEICGASYLPTRYSERNGFNNPSVYCADLLKVITHVRNAVIGELKKTGNPMADEMDLLTYEEAVDMLRENMQEPYAGPDYSEELESFARTPNARELAV